MARGRIRRSMADAIGAAGGVRAEVTLRMDAVDAEVV